MMRSVLPLCLLIVAGAAGGLSAVEDNTKKLQIEYDDWAPGEVGPWTSSSLGGDDDLPPCDYIDEAETRDCEITPETRPDPPAVAPERCYYYDWTYEPEIYLSFGCG